MQLVENGSKHNWRRACLFLWQVPSIAVAIPAASPPRTTVFANPARAAQANSTGSDFAALMDTLMPQIVPSVASADTVEPAKAAPAKGGSQSGNGHVVDKDNPKVDKDNPKIDKENPKEDKRKTDQDPSTPAPPLPQKAEPVLPLLDWAIPVQVPPPAHTGRYPKRRPFPRPASARIRSAARSFACAPRSFACARDKLARGNRIASSVGAGDGGGGTTPSAFKNENACRSPAGVTECSSHAGWRENGQCPEAGVGV